MICEYAVFVFGHVRTIDPDRARDVGRRIREPFAIATYPPTRTDPERLLLTSASGVFRFWPQTGTFFLLSQ